MRFNLIDKIELLTDDRIVGVKHVTLAEEYLGDHFPTFPVLPGVLMLEAAVQSAGWLLHHRRQFKGTFAVLKQAKNVKYGYFVAPGNALRMDVEWKSDTDTGATFRVTGTVGDKTAVQARIDISYFRLADQHAELADVDARIDEHNRRRWDLIRPANGTVAL